VFTRSGNSLKYKIESTSFIAPRNVIMYTTELSHEGHSRRFILGEAPLGGWELRVEEDHAVVSRVRYTDWHRVERALGTIARRVSELEAGGWQITAATAP
jgi:hypothetical protein